MALLLAMVISAVGLLIIYSEIVDSALERRFEDNASAVTKLLEHLMKAEKEHPQLIPVLLSEASETHQLDDILVTVDGTQYASVDDAGVIQRLDQLQWRYPAPTDHHLFTPFYDIGNMRSVFFSGHVITPEGSEWTISTTFDLPPYMIANLKRNRDVTLAFILITALLLAVMIFPLVSRQYSTLLEKQQQLLESHSNLLLSMGRAVALRDSDTNEHNYRVVIYSAWMGELLELSADRMRGLLQGALLHDIGKIGITDSILLKPGRLTDDEVAEMRTHVDKGVELVAQQQALEGASQVIANHHEKYDGSGYPAGVVGEDIPLEARIFALSDVFDALSSERPYKQPYPLERTLEIIADDAGSHFDPQLAELFCSYATQWHEKVSGMNNQQLEQVFRQMLARYLLR
ncbi:MAG: HD-GYP domain-containing protein [Motiliproteus sp.]|nr:HD-GYP domain-containing protein [Motiliproteus sp.]MCW9051398.1 HD-GYP domain-containing protein [Motiliproteus sp.]